jgi:hypothetical protein
MVTIPQLRGGNGGSMNPTVCLTGIANAMREANDCDSTEHMLNLTFECKEAARHLIDWLARGGNNPDFVEFYKTHVFLNLDGETRVIIDTLFDDEPINLWSLFRNGRCIDRRVFRPAR